MKQKNAVKFWYNLKGCYDVLIFDNKRNLEKFTKEYKTIFENLEDEKIDFEEFEYLQNDLSNKYEKNIIKYDDEFYYKDFLKDKYYNEFYFDYIDGVKTKINILESLNYWY